LRMADKPSRAGSTSETQISNTGPPGGCSKLLTQFPEGEELIVQNHIEQRAVYLQTAVVLNKAQFPEPVHEEANP